jgi:hypothetical protein
VVRTCGTCKIFEYLKLYQLSLFCNILSKTGGAIPFIILKVSIAINLVLRTCHLGNLTLTNNSSYEEVLSKYAKRNALS